VPLDAGGGNDNSVPFEYDLSGGALAFGLQRVQSTRQRLNNY